jgi:putative transcriptional regulator
VTAPDWDGRPLTGRLLLATPVITHGIFHRSVILVLHHDDSGAQGVVVNAPLEATVDAVLPGWQDLLTAPGNLFQGGPVSLDSALGLVAVPGPLDAPVGVKRLFGRVGVIDLDTPPELVETGLAGMRVFAGYAGWSAGQLEDELREGSWWVVPAEGRDAFSAEPQELWQAILRRQGEPLAWVATYPEDPDLN